MTTSDSKKTSALDTDWDKDIVTFSTTPPTLRQLAILSLVTALSFACNTALPRSAYAAETYVRCIKERQDGDGEAAAIRDLTIDSSARTFTDLLAAKRQENFLFWRSHGMTGTYYVTQETEEFSDKKIRHRNNHYDPLELGPEDPLDLNKMLLNRSEILEINRYTGEFMLTEYTVKRVQENGQWTAVPGKFEWFRTSWGKCSAREQVF